LFLNRDEARWHAPLRVWQRMPHPVVIKLGSEGARVVGRRLDLRARPPRARVVDATGAGDVFNAGFLAAQLRGALLPDALRLANQVAAKSTERVGGL
jgi:ribokinase